MNPIPENIRNNVSDVLSRYPVSKAAVFGSFARGEANFDSDIDMLVEFYRPVGVRFFGLKEDLENAVKRLVDLFRYSDFLMSPRYEEIIREAQTIYVCPANQHS